MIIQLSHKIDDSSPFYGGRKGFSYQPESSIEKGDTANTQKWELHNHLGTHIDFPFHFYQNGQTVDDFPEDFWVFDGRKIQVLEIILPENTYLIQPNHIQKKYIKFDAELLILNTGISKFRDEERFWKFNPGISIEMADWIVENFKNLKVIGLDSISASSWQHRDVGRDVHKKMLNPDHPVLIIEDMDLTKVSRNTIFEKVFVAPVMVKGADGGPCTILAEVR